MSFSRPPRLLVSLFAAVALLLSACGGGSSETTAESAELTGIFTTTAGQSINLETYEGQDVVLWFWAPW